jgi:hypothetical protein
MATPRPLARTKKLTFFSDLAFKDDGNLSISDFEITKFETFLCTQLLNILECYNFNTFLRNKK